jgi:hypothetical protein
MSAVNTSECSSVLPVIGGIGVGLIIAGALIGALLYFKVLLVKSNNTSECKKCESCNNNNEVQPTSGYLRQGQILFTKKTTGDYNILENDLKLEYNLVVGQDGSVRITIPFSAEFLLKQDCYLLSNPLDTILAPYSINIRKPINSCWQIKGGWTLGVVEKTANNELKIGKLIQNSPMVKYPSADTGYNYNQSLHIWTSFDLYLTNQETYVASNDLRNKMNQNERVLIKNQRFKFVRNTSTTINNNNNINLFDVSSPVVYLDSIMIYRTTTNKTWQVKLLVPPAPNFFVQNAACKYVSEPTKVLYGLMNTTVESNHKVMMNDCGTYLSGDVNIVEPDHTKKTAKVEMIVTDNRRTGTDPNRNLISNCGGSTSITSNGPIGVDILLDVDVSKHEIPSPRPNAEVEHGVFKFSPSSLAVTDGATKGNPNRIANTVTLPFIFLKQQENDMILIRYSESKDYGPKHDNIFVLTEKTCWFESDPHYLLAGYENTYYTGSVNRNGGLNFAKVDIIPVGIMAGKIRITPWIWNNGWVEGSFECGSYGNNGCLLGVNDIIVPLMSRQNQNQ